MDPYILAGEVTERGFTWVVSTYGCIEVRTISLPQLTRGLGTRVKLTLKS
jgi:hypothetical protein